MFRTLAYFLRHSPQLVWRCLRHRGKRAFLTSLINTYYSNYINLCLVFRDTRSDRELRRIAFDAVMTFVRNAALYEVPRSWRGFEHHNPEALDRALTHGKGLVVACQHLGPQRYAMLEIGLRGIEAHAMMTAQFMDRCHAWCQRVADDLVAGEQVDGVRRVGTLAVEEPTCALKMVRALKRGEAVIMDIDGNIGVGGEERTLKGTMTLDFLGRQVHVRTGVAYLAYRTGAPILPLISLWDRRGRAHLHYHEPIVAKPGESRDAFTERSLKAIYGLLEENLRERPDQWEMWPHFFKWLSPPPPFDAAQVPGEVERLEGVLNSAPETAVTVDPRSVFMLRIRGRRLLVDSHHFRFFLASPITERVLRRLHPGTTLARVTAELAPRYSRQQVLRELGRFAGLQVLHCETAA